MSTLLVKVEKISKVEKHPNADKLSIVSMKGNAWNCITGLDQYKSGDLIVFCPPDSMIPDNLIEKYDLEYLKKDGRVRTVKLRGYISQGLILDIPEGKNWKDGQEVGKELNIQKYAAPAPKYQQFKPRYSFKQLFQDLVTKKITFKRFVFKFKGLVKDLFKKKKNPNPLFSKYTNIENVKNYHSVFKETDEVIITEKIHGTNFRAGYVHKKKNKWKFWDKDTQEFCYGSHKVQLTGNRGKQCWYGEDVYGQISEKYKLAEIIPEDYVIYGEIYGKGIQGASYDYGLKDKIDAVFFDIKYKGEYLDYYSFLEFCLQRDLPTVPEQYRGKFTKSMLELCTKGESFLYSKLIKEGCVVKTIKEENDKRVGRKVLKSINPEYLLIKGGTDNK